MSNLFENDAECRREKLANTHFAKLLTDELLARIADVEQISPFRHMTTPGGFSMSVALTNCGKFGWTSDRGGYRYTTEDPLTNQPWPQMPGTLLELAQSAALEAGLSKFLPNACLINRYALETKLSLHKNKDEPDLNAPIVSVSLGIPAMFQFGGFERTGKKIRGSLLHGDVVIWGGVDRLKYDGVLPIKSAVHPILGEQRLT